MMYARGQSNLSHDFNAYDASNQIWNGSAYESEVVANYASYRISATKNSDANAAGIDATFSATAPGGAVRYVMRERGATLADSYVVWAEQLLLAAIKADTDLGTATGGMVANVALLVREETQISGTDADMITIVRNDTVSFTFDVTTDFTGYTGLLTIRHRVTDDELMQVSVTVTSSVLLTVPLSSTDTAFTDLVSLTEFGPHPFDIQMTSGSTVKTPVTGVAVIRRDQTT